MRHTHTHKLTQKTRVPSHRAVKIVVAAPPSLPSDKLSLKHLSSFPLRKTRNNTSTFNESCALPRHPNLLNPTPDMNAVVHRSSIGVLFLLFSGTFQHPLIPLRVITDEILLKRNNGTRSLKNPLHTNALSGNI